MTLVARNSPAGFEVIKALVNFNELKEVTIDRKVEICAILIILSSLNRCRGVDVKSKRNEEEIMGYVRMMMGGS